MKLNVTKQVNPKETRIEDQKSHVTLSSEEFRDIVLVFKLLQKWQKEAKDFLEKENKH